MKKEFHAMKIFGFLVILVSIVLAAPFQVPANRGIDQEIKWTTYNDAQKAGNDARKLFVYFFSDRCGYCELMDEKTFKDKAVVAYINSNYRPVRVNTGEERKIAVRFGIQGVPDLRFLTFEGEGIARWPGFIESAHLLTLLQYINTDSYKEMNYSDFVNSQKQKE
jgi:thioredoxin-related protein